ncbi:MAG: hypothetical protein ABI443_07865 [Chthoniobacterales bacterium]
MITKIRISFLLAVALLLPVLCMAQSGAPRTINPSNLLKENSAVNNVVNEFFAKYMEGTQQKSWKPATFIVGNKLLTPAFQTSYAEYMKRVGDNPDIDPIIGAFDIPKAPFLVSSTDIKDSKGTLLLNTKDPAWKSHRITVQIIKVGGEWKINGINSIGSK